jgi:short-subunit dehydrogenase
MICPYWVITEFHEAQLNKNGLPRGPKGRFIYTKGMMTADRCAEIILHAADRRKREIMMGPGKLVVWMKTLAPGMMDWYTERIFFKSIRQRLEAAMRNTPPGSNEPKPG